MERLPPRACVLVRYIYWELANRLCNQCMHRHPDECVAHLLDVAPTVVTKAAKHQREELKNPPGTVDEFLATLEQQALVRTVAVLPQFAEQI